MEKDNLKPHPLPINHNLAKAKQIASIQPLDLYTWLTYRFSNLKKDVLIPWKLLMRQFGTNNEIDAASIRHFKMQLLQALLHVKIAYPAANVQVDEKGLVLKQQIFSRKILC